jgi:NADH-quinone oxidoreductase subunit A
MLYQFGAVLVFILIGSLFVGLGLLFGSLIRRTRKSSEKAAIYECGEPTIGSSWIRYNSRFYNVALVYLLFDVEVVVLIPALLAFRQQVAAHSAGPAFAALLFFFFLLAFGLAYEWYCGNLDWIRRQDEPNQPDEIGHSDRNR